jgi:hypothetical protein
LQKWYPRWWNLSIFKLISILNRFSIISLHKLSIRQHLFDTHNWICCMCLTYGTEIRYCVGTYYGLTLVSSCQAILQIHKSLLFPFITTYNPFLKNQGWHSHCKPSRENQGWHAHTPNKEKMESTSYWKGYSTSTRYIQYTRTRIISAIAAYITHALCNWYII